MTGPSDLEGRASAMERCDDHDERMAAEFAGASANDPVTPVVPAPVTDQRPRFAFVHISEYLGDLKPPEWLIRDIVETDSLLMIFGDPESGKSFLAMDWAASVAAGREWNGYKVRQGAVLYINGEGRNGINRRFKAWQIANQCELQAHPIFFSTITTALTDEVSRAEIEAVIAEFIRDHGKPLLIVIDTLARNYGPGDENSTQDMTKAIATCDAIREMTGATVALVHHSGHGDKNRGRGSMALRGALDAEYRMQRTEEGDTNFECTKMKDAERPVPLAFRFCQVELGLKDDDDREVTSAVLRTIEYEAPEEQGFPKSGRPAGGGRNQAKALEILSDRYRKNLANVIQAGRSADQARVALEVWRDLCTSGGIPDNRFREVRNSLINSGKVKSEFGFVYPVEAP